MNTLCFGLTSSFLAMECFMGILVRLRKSHSLSRLSSVWLYIFNQKKKEKRKKIGSLWCFSGVY